MFIEQRNKRGKTKYYLAYSLRHPITGKVRKIRKYLGTNLTEDQRKQAAFDAEEFLLKKLKNTSNPPRSKSLKTFFCSGEKVRTTKKLRTFSVERVKKTASQYNKAFHAKLFTLFASSESEVYSFAQRFSPHYTFCFAFMEHDEGQWFLDQKGIIRVRNWVVRTTRINPEMIITLHEAWEKDLDHYRALASELLATNLSKLSDKELYNIFEQFYTRYLRVGSIAYICDSFMSTGTTDWLEELLVKELQQRQVDLTTLQKEVRILTSPVHLSFTLEAEYQLLKVAKKISAAYPKLPSLYRFKQDKPSLYNSLKNLEKNFYWIQNNYYNVCYLDVEYFYEQVGQALHDAQEHGTTVSRLRENKEAELKELSNAREHLITSLGLSPFAKNLLRVARLFAKWKDIRKSGVYIGMHHFDRFLEELAQRTSYTKHQLTFSVFPEIKALLFEKKDFTEEFARREKRAFFAVTPRGYYVASGEKAASYFNIFEQQEVEQLVELRGVIASPGYARGRVRIIRKTEDMHAFKVGEILVTNQTTPEFVPCMKKAAAIITEQGGITSHAAIVSRELKKPCIIGTKIATKVLMDGEVVEVDARNGIVRRER